MRSVEELPLAEKFKVIRAACNLFEAELVDSIDRRDVTRNREILEMARVLLAVDGSLGDE